MFTQRFPAIGDSSVRARICIWSATEDQSKHTLRHISQSVESISGTGPNYLLIGGPPPTTTTTIGIQYVRSDNSNSRIGDLIHSQMPEFVWALVRERDGDSNR